MGDFLVVHRVADEALAIAVNRFDIDPDRTVAEHADGGLATVAQAEMKVGTPDNRGFSVFSKLENGLFGDTMFFSQPLA